MYGTTTQRACFLLPPSMCANTTRPCNKATTLCCSDAGVLAKIHLQMTVYGDYMSLIALLVWIMYL